MNILKRYPIAMIIVLVSIGCSRPAVAPPKTQLQIREFQTRTFNVNNIKLVLKAMMNVLQDDGFIIKTANADLGLLSATKEVELNRDVFSIGPIVIRDTGGSTGIITECSANISEFGNNIKVRINFLEKEYDRKGVREVRTINDEIYYQSFFMKVDKGLFIEKEKL